MLLVRTALLFAATAVAEILGCYLPYLWLRKGRPVWVLAPAALSLAIFSWLLTLHPTAAGRTYAAYGGIYIGVALLWLWLVEGEKTDGLGHRRGVRGDGGDGDHRPRPTSLATWAREAQADPREGLDS